MQIHWYPGHMAKAKRQLEERLKLVDAIIELCDARAPRSTRNPDLVRMAAGKARMLVLNKADLAEPAMTRKWLAAFEGEGVRAISFNGTSSKGVKELDAHVNDIVSEIVERKRARGIRKTVRVMVIGIPNVGKSTLINRYIGRNRANVADRPGVTRGAQWLKVSEHLELLDTPGLLWPKLDDKICAENLAFIGSIRDDIMDQEALAALLLKRFIGKPYLLKRFNINDLDGAAIEPHALLDAACKGRGWIRAGGVPDTQRGAAIVLDEFRQGRCGAVTLDEL